MIWRGPVVWVVRVVYSFLLLLIPLFIPPQSSIVFSRPTRRSTHEGVLLIADNASISTSDMEYAESRLVGSSPLSLIHVVDNSARVLKGSKVHMLSSRCFGECHHILVPWLRLVLIPAGILASMSCLWDRISPSRASTHC